MQPVAKVNVAVLMGGQTAEHEISLQTGVQIANALDRSRYRVHPLVITRNGQWRWVDKVLDTAADSLTTDDLPSQDGSPADSAAALQRLVPSPTREVEVGLIALHGPNGEDGTVQGLLQLMDLPYTGSGVLASALAMDKPLAKRVFQQAGLTVPPGIVVDSDRWHHDCEVCLVAIQEHPGLPCVVKPAAQGSSVGTSICETRAEVEAAVALALEYEPTAMVEEYVRGTELTCGVLEEVENRHPVALPVIEIVPQTAFFDYEAKYDPDLTEEIVPARVPPEVTQAAQEVAVTAHRALGCSAMSRTDMILRDGTLYVMELNTIPGMTPASLLPKAVGAAGISFPQFLDRLIALALEDHRRRPASPGDSSSAG